MSIINGILVLIIAEDVNKEEKLMSESIKSNVPPMPEQPTKLCKHCQTQIPKNAKVCPNCRKKQSGILKWIIIVVVVLVIIAAISGGSGDDSSNTNKTSSNNAVTNNDDANKDEANKDEANKNEDKNDASEEQPETEKEIEYIKCSAQNLVDIMQSNAMKASSTYKDKYIEVTGYLSVIDSDGKYFSINAGDEDYSFVNIQCFIQDDEQKEYIMNCSKGDEITVKGECTDVGEILGYSIDITELK